MKFKDLCQWDTPVGSIPAMYIAGDSKTSLIKLAEDFTDDEFVYYKNELVRVPNKVLSLNRT